MPVNRVRVVHQIPNTKIVIDDWKRKGRDLLRFISRIPMSKKDMRFLKESDYKIYARTDTAWYLTELVNINRDRLLLLEVNIPTKISKNNEDITVTAFDAHYSIGSSMFLFQGKFGNILYTGYFRPSIEISISEIPIIKELVKEKSIHTIYIDNFYASEMCKFPSRQSTVTKTIALIKKYPNHRIILSDVLNDKEELILSIAKALNVKMFVSEERFNLYRCIKAEEFVTRDPKENKLTVLDKILGPEAFRKMKSTDDMCMIFVFTGLYSSLQSKAPKITEPNFHVMPYTSHCSHEELMEFLSELKPQEIKPIILNEWNPNFKIPQCMLDLCYVPTDSKFPLDSDFQYLYDSSEKNGGTQMPNQQVPIPVSYDSNGSPDSFFSCDDEMSSQSMPANSTSVSVGECSSAQASKPIFKHHNAGLEENLMLFKREPIIKLARIEMINETARRKLLELQSSSERSKIQNGSETCFRKRKSIDTSPRLNFKKSKTPPSEPPNVQLISPESDNYTAVFLIENRSEDLNIETSDVDDLPVYEGTDEPDDDISNSANYVLVDLEKATNVNKFSMNRKLGTEEPYSPKALPDMDIDNTDAMEKTVDSVDSDNIPLINFTKNSSHISVRSNEIHLNDGLYSLKDGTANSNIQDNQTQSSNSNLNNRSCSPTDLNTEQQVENEVYIPNQENSSENTGEQAAQRPHINYKLHKLLYLLNHKVEENVDLRRNIWDYVSERTDSNL